MIDDSDDEQIDKNTIIKNEDEVNMDKLKSNNEYLNEIDTDILMEDNNISENHYYDNSKNKFIFDKGVAEKLSSIDLTKSKSFKEIKEKL